MTITLNHATPLFPTRKIVHMSMLGFAFLLPFLTWLQAAGAAVLALLFNLLILPRLEVDLGKRPARASAPPARVSPVWTTQPDLAPATTTRLHAVESAELFGTAVKCR